MPNPNGVVAGNAQNVPEAHVPRTRSKFPLHYHFFNTHRFGEYMPHYVSDMNKDEDFPVHSSHDLRSYTLEAPLMQSIRRNKDYFLVPMESILPLNWEKFFDNPVRGDDVLDDVGPTVNNFWSKSYSLFTQLLTSLSTLLADASATTASKLLGTLRFLVLTEYVYSNGNLLASLGFHGSSYIIVRDPNGNEISFDDFFDVIIDEFASYLVGGVYLPITVDGIAYRIYSDPSVDKSYGISLRHALQLMRDDPTFVVSTPSSGWDNLPQTLYDDFRDYSITFVNAEVPLNLDRLWAYQLCCAHYFSNDHIDFVYSAELFRQLVGNYILVQTANTWTSGMNFTRNGLTYRYDYLSAHFCDKFFTYSASASLAADILTTTNSATRLGILGYFSALFGYRRSLRYLDYFTGSRSQPLAVVNTGQINTNVAVNNNQVSVIDITRSIQAQRFLNSVNRVRHNFEGYLKGVFGGDTPAPDYHNPFYIAHTDDVVYGQETENTADAQMSYKIAITTNLRSNSNRYMFDVHSDRPCICIGITSYDIARVYSHSAERSFFHVSRFDWFNPFMQYIGDQPIYLQELGINVNSGLTSMKNFSYTLRHMEYKQRFNQAAGGFCNNTTQLNNWLFLAKDYRGAQDTINPDWIRSLNAEFDDFYVSLTGYSLGTYFHFIVDDYNSCDASRPMAFAPQILG